MEGTGAIGRQGRRSTAPPGGERRDSLHLPKPSPWFSRSFLSRRSLPSSPEGIFLAAGNYLRSGGNQRDMAMSDYLAGAIHMPWNAPGLIRRTSLPSLQRSAVASANGVSSSVFPTPLQPGTDFPLCRVFLCPSRRGRRASGGSRPDSRARRRWPSRLRRYRRPPRRSRRYCRP